MLEVSALGICPAFIKTRGVATQTNLHGQRVITGKSGLNSSNCEHHISPFQKNLCPFPHG